MKFLNLQGYFKVKVVENCFRVSLVQEPIGGLVSLTKRTFRQGHFATMPLCRLLAIFVQVLALPRYLARYECRGSKVLLLPVSLGFMLAMLPGVMLAPGEGDVNGGCQIGLLGG